MKAKDIINRIKIICGLYKDEADRMEGKLPKDSWWEGYHIGQRKLAEHILKRISEEGL